MTTSRTSTTAIIITLKVLRVLRLMICSASGSIPTLRISK